MGKNKLLKDKHEGPEVKKQRQDYSNYASNTTRDMSTDEVEIYNTCLNIEGLVANISYRSNTASQSLEQVKRRIAGDEARTIGTKKYLLYPAFKEALLRLVMQIEEVLTDERNKIRLILIHGVPKIGKSSLAQCLSYFLALHTGQEERVLYLQLSHSAKLDDNVLTDSITHAGSEKYLIVDQVNTYCLIFSEIIENAESRLKVAENRMPLIMFTSGHYTPSEKWVEFQKSKLLSYKIITMKIDAHVVTELRNSMDVPEDTFLSNNHLLNVTTFYSRMIPCLDHLRGCDSGLNEDALREVIYPRAHLDDIKKQSGIHFVWLAWNAILSKGLPLLQKFTDDDCKMKPQHAEYLGFLISGTKDKAGRGINAILNQTETIGHNLYEKNGYTEISPDSYYYKYLNRKCLYDVLASAVDAEKKYPPEKKLKILLDAFNVLRKTEEFMLNYVKVGILALLIKYICKRETEVRDKLVGMKLESLAAGLDFIKVDFCEEVGTEIDLCNLPLKHQKCKDCRSTFWCVLNVPGKQQFNGYDFAYMVTMPNRNMPVVERLQLFQVTISPEGKSREKKLIMTEILDKIKDELEKRKLIKRSEADNVVVPYFVHPYADNRKVVLPYSYSTKLIVVDILGFPQERLEVE